MNINILDIFYKNIVPEATTGRIDCNCYYNMIFSTRIMENNTFYCAKTDNDSLLVPTLVIKNKKLQKHYHLLKQKENKTLYDYIFMNAFTNKIVNVLKDDLKVKKIQNVNNLSCYIHRVNKIDIYFNYQKHYVKLFIYNDKITYQIDTPEEYDILESNKQFEQIKTIDVNLNIISYFDKFVDLFSNVIINIKQDIDTFKLDNKVDSFFNGKILSNFEASTSYLKLEGIVCTIGGIIFVPLCAIIL